MIILMPMNFDHDDDEAHGLIVFSLTQLIGVAFLGYCFLVQQRRCQGFSPPWRGWAPILSSAEKSPENEVAGSGITDSGFLDSLRNEQSSERDGDQDLDNYEQQRYEKQEKRIKNLQATVDAQTELLKAIADKLQI